MMNQKWFIFIAFLMLVTFSFNERLRVTFARTRRNRNVLNLLLLLPFVVSLDQARDVVVAVLDGVVNGRLAEFIGARRRCAAAQ